MQNLKERTIDFAIRVARICAKLPNDGVAAVARTQVLRSGTSVGAQYREAYRARSGREYVSKMRRALQELDETTYWLELLRRDERLGSDPGLAAEADELCAVFYSCIRKAESRAGQD